MQLIEYANKYGSNPPDGQAVQVFGGASAYSFGTALNETVTPTGHSFGVFPSDWPMQPGSAAWFGVALPDGNFAFAGMCLPLSESNVTAYTTSVYIWNTTTYRLQCINIPTSTGYFSPPWTNTTATGAAVDQLVPVTISGTNYIFGICSYPFGGWRILGSGSVAGYGEPYSLWAIKELSPGNWVFDPTHSYTATQMQATSAAGALTFPALLTSPNNAYYDPKGPGAMCLMPNSNHLIIGTYFHANTNPSNTVSGYLYSVDPATGIVEGFYQVPAITDINGCPISYSLRDLVSNPLSSLGDERFIITPDVYILAVGATGSIAYPGPPTSGTYVGGNSVKDSNNVIWYCSIGGTPGTWQKGSGYPLHTITEMSYDWNGTAGVFSVKSPPMSPYSLPNTGYILSYNLARYDGDGNLWLPTHGGLGAFGVFDSEEMHIFLSSGANIPTFEAGGVGVGWGSVSGGGSQFPTFTFADFRAGSFGYANGQNASLNWDGANGRVILVSAEGLVTGGTLAGSPAFGPQLVTNQSMATTTGWSGFVGTSSVAPVTDAAFIIAVSALIPAGNATGTCIELTSVNGTSNDLVQVKLPVTQLLNYWLSFYVRAPSVPQPVFAQIWWYNVNGVLISATAGPTVSEPGTGLTYCECLVQAPPGAVTAFLMANIKASSVSEKHRVGNVSWVSVPVTATLPLNTNSSAFTNGVPQDSAKGDIIGGQLYLTTCSTASQFGTTITQTGASGGTITLSWKSLTTAPVAWNASAATVLAALVALSGFSPTATATGGPLGTAPVFVNQVGITGTSSLTGGSLRADSGPVGWNLPQWLTAIELSAI